MRAHGVSVEPFLWVPVDALAPRGCGALRFGPKMSKRTLRTFRREFFTKRQPGKFQNEHCENRSFVCFSRTYFSKHACVVVLCALRASCCCRHRCSHRHGKFARERKQDLKQNWCCFVKAVVPETSRHDTACAHDMSHDPAQVHSEVGWGGAEGAQARCGSRRDAHRCNGQGCRKWRQTCASLGGVARRLGDNTAFAPSASWSDLDCHRAANAADTQMEAQPRNNKCHEQPQSRPETQTQTESVLSNVVHSIWLVEHGSKAE